jgi:ribosomal protein S18 acetylase RimI-like enzyme
MRRDCGTCTLCCKLLPMQQGNEDRVDKVLAKMVEVGWERHGVEVVPDFDKPAGVRCKHQRMKGCAIYRKRPFGCRYWNCRWLVNDDTADLSRPDRAHYVIDIVPDYVTCIDNESGEHMTIEVVQIWVDPDYREAWRDPALLAFLDRRGKEGKIALLRFDARDGITLFPPSMSPDGEWHEVAGQAVDREHTMKEKLVGIASAYRGVGP